MLWLALALALAVVPGGVRAERSLLSPVPGEPVVIAPGATLRLVVDVATGLSPPPGVQEDRAHRAFAIRLCARGLDLGAGERRCFPLRVRNVRPLDATSLRYRVEALLPVWLAPGSYALTLRFPGGEQTVADGVLVARTPAERQPRPDCLAQTQGDGALAIRAAQGGCRARLHVGARGLVLHGAGFEPFPQPDSAGGLAAGFVALLQLAPEARVSVTKRQAQPDLGLSVEPHHGFAGAKTSLWLRGARGDAEVFWWLGPEHSARGAQVNTTFLYPGPHPIETLAVLPDGRVQRARQEVSIWQRRAFGCSVSAHPAAGGHAIWAILCVGLPWIARSRKLRPLTWCRARRLLERSA